MNSIHFSSASDAGKRFPFGKFVFIDTSSVGPITALTDSAANNAATDPTHPQWAADGKHIIYRFNR